MVLIAMVGALLGIAVAMAHTDNAPAVVITPPLAPLQVPEYGNRE